MFEAIRSFLQRKLRFIRLWFKYPGLQLKTEWLSPYQQEPSGILCSGSVNAVADQVFFLENTSGTELLAWPYVESEGVRIFTLPPRVTIAHRNPFSGKLVPLHPIWWGRRGFSETVNKKIDQYLKGHRS